MQKHGGDIYSNNVKLDFSVNLNPLGVLAAVKNAAASAVLSVDKYPDPNCTKIRELLAKYLSGDAEISTDMILMGNGATELIAAVCRSLYVELCKQECTLQRCMKENDGNASELCKQGCALQECVKDDDASVAKLCKQGCASQERVKDDDVSVAKLCKQGYPSCAQVKLNSDGIDDAELCKPIKRDTAPHILIPAPSFYEYEKSAKAAMLPARKYYMKKENGYRLDEAFLNCISSNTIAVMLCNPNNPTGALTNQRLILDILEKCQRLGVYLILDESFIQLSDGKNFLCYVNRYDKLIIIRSFTKAYAMPSLRLGYILSSNRKFVDIVKNQLPEWNVSGISMAAGEASLFQDEYLNKSRECIKIEREYLMNELKSPFLKNLIFEVYPSDTCYIMFRAKRVLYDALLDAGILIRNCESFDGLDDSYFRIAIKTREENITLLNAIHHIAGCVR